MSTKFDKAPANEYLKIGPNAALAFPPYPQPWTLFWTMVFNGANSSTDRQYVLSFGTFQAAGSLQVAYAPSTDKMEIYVDTSGVGVVGSATHAGGSGGKQFALSFDGTNLTLRSIAVLATEPANGAGVTTELTLATSVTFNADDEIFVGARNDLISTRFLDQSLARLGFHAGYLTNHEVAQLAYGKQITEIGKTAPWYVRLDTHTDIADLGTQANTVASFGTLSTGPAPGYGFTPVLAAPVITGTPTVTGTPQTGVPLAYSPAGVTGYPTPTRTQQWRLDGVDVGATYTPVAGDIGKVPSVRQIETNSEGSVNATSANGPAIIDASPIITVVSPIDDKIFIRSNGAAAVALSGSYSGHTPATIEYQLYAANGTTVLQAWTALTATIGSGTWSATPSVPQGGMYRIAVRSSQATSAIHANLWGVGAACAVAGSSSAEYLFTDKSGTTHTPNPNIRRYGTGGNVYSEFASTGAAIIIANKLYDLLGVPILMIDTGDGGTTLGDWLSSGSTPWINFRDRVTNIGRKLEFLALAVGSNDAADGLVTSRLSHANRLKQLVANICTHTSQASIPTLIAGTNRRTAHNAGITDAAYNLQIDYVRMAEQDVGQEPGYTYVSTIDLPMLADNTHLSVAGYTTSATRQGDAAVRLLSTGASSIGPRISGMSWAGSTITATIAHNLGTDFTPTSGITGFVVTDGSGTPGITSVARTSATAITITCNRALVDPVDVTYHAGAAPDVSTPVLDNAATPTLMRAETDMVASSTADTTAPVMTGSVSTANVTPTTATVSWAAATDAVGIARYEYSTNGGSTYTSAGMSLSAALTGLTASTAYALRVRAFDAAENVSNVITGTLNTSAAPDTTAPTLAGSVTTSNVTATTATITWPAATDNVGVTRYEYSVNGGTSYTNAGTALSAALTGLTGSTTYQLRVRALDAAGNTSAVIQGSLITAVPPDVTAPTLAGAIQASSVTSNGAVITWPAATDNVGVARYEYSTNGGTSYTNAGTALSVTLTGLTAATTYQLRARAVDAAENVSSVITGTLVTLAEPVAPVDFVPSVSRTVQILAGKTVYNAGAFWTVTGSAGPVANKDPNSTIDIHFEWAPWLADIGNAKLSNVTFSLGNGLEAAGVIPTLTGGTIFVSGGTLNTNGTVTCRVTTNTTPPRIEERTVTLAIREQ